MAEIFPFQRSAKPSLRARWSYLPWQPLAMLILVAATFGVVQFVDTSTHQLSQQLDSPVKDDTSPAADMQSPISYASMPLCVGWPRLNCVIDGDTIWYEGTKIRIADINAPETHNPHCAYEADLGRRATNRLIELLSAGPFEIVALGGRDEDVYGRKLRVIERNGRSLGQTLVNEGLAERWRGWRRSWCA